MIVPTPALDDSLHGGSPALALYSEYRRYCTRRAALHSPFVATVALPMCPSRQVAQRHCVVIPDESTIMVSTTVKVSDTSAQVGICFQEYRMVDKEVPV